MKTVYKMLVICMFTMTTWAARAQILKSERPYTFKNVADKVDAPVDELARAFSAREGSAIELKMHKFQFKGVVTSSIKRYDNLYSVVIKSSDSPNTVFALSKRINDDKTISYVGRIINQRSADGFELTQAADGRYMLNKIKTEDLLQDY